MVSLIVLAGGESKRIGKDKGLIKLLNKPLILWVVESILDFADEVIVCIGKNQDLNSYKAILPSDVKIVVEDEELRSPVFGFLHGLKVASFEYSIILACDMPFVRKDVIKFIASEAKGFDACIPIWKCDKIEPLHACYKTKPTVKAVEEAIKEGKLSNKGFIEKINVNYLNVSRLRCFDEKLTFLFNINTIDDLKQAERIAGTF
jgi:molybdopterin-guanine dinucleotide biosynthesis protein A